MKKTTDSKSIKQWLRRQKKQITAGTIEDWRDGVKMPVVGAWEHLCPAGKAYLFSVTSDRRQYVTDENHVSQYKRGKWRTVSKGHHYVHVVSIAVAHERTLQWLRGPSDVVVDYVLPEGWRWRRDDLGFAAIDPEGYDYHPYWTANITVENILESHAANKTKRIRQEESDRARIGENLATYAGTFVLLEDSRRAGNCVEGSLAWAEQRLKLSRELILAAPAFIKVPAERLIQTLDERALRAVRCAYERETTVAI